ncbi:hypothetical protein M3J09_010959 [Ascochyta lentis]
MTLQHHITTSQAFYIRPSNHRQNKGTRVSLRTTNYSMLLRTIPQTDMNVHVPETRRRAASRDSTPSSPTSQTSNSSDDANNPTKGKIKQVIACCRRQIERFASAPRSDEHEENDDEDISLCFELRRFRSNGSQSQAHPRRTRMPRPSPLTLVYSRQESYQFYMDEDNCPFITTPSCMGMENSPKFTTFLTPPSV